MVNVKKIGALLLATTTFLASCKKDSETLPSNSVPSTYTFVNSKGESTVSFSGQTQRLDMLAEMSAYAKSANTSQTTISADTLKAMFDNTYASWTDATLIGSSKQLKNKTAGGNAGIIAKMEEYMDSLSVISNLKNDNTSQTYGIGGVWSNGTKSYLQSGKGVEYVQMLEKSLMGAVFLNQMSANYLGNIASDDNTVIVEGKTYTTMQHHWDEAYGYFTSATDYPTSGTDRFWGKYADGRESLIGSASKIATAFRTGRAAIDNNDYDTRDAQVVIINTEMEKLSAASAIHYLNSAKDVFGVSSNLVLFNHYISEAVAFTYCLKFGKNTSSYAAAIDTALSYLDEDFSAIKLTDINSLIGELSLAADLKDVETSL